MNGDNDIGGLFRCKNRLNFCKAFCGSSPNTAAGAAAAAGIVIGGVTYISYKKDNTLNVNWKAIIKTFNELDWNKLLVKPPIPLEVVTELETLYNTLITTLEDDINEQEIWIIIKALGIKEIPLKKISNKLFGETNFFSKKIEEMYKTNSYMEIASAFYNAGIHRNTIKNKLKAKMEDTNFIDNQVKPTYSDLIFFIKNNDLVQITYPGLDGINHTVYITPTDIYYSGPNNQSISFFNLLEKQDERETFQNNYKKVFQNMFGVPEEQIMLRF